MKLALNRSLLDRVLAWYREWPRARRDLVVIFALSIPLYAVIVSLDAFDRVSQWIVQHEYWELDEIIALIFCLGLAGIVYAHRRVTDLRQEVAQRQEAEREAHRLARHDVLTGLPNRRRFLEEFPRRTSNLPDNNVCALLVIDLDHFKPINDLYGHRLGDEVLRVIAIRLSNIVGSDGMVARLGGDEFGILMPVTNCEDAQVHLAWRIAHEISKPIKLAALVLEVGVSVGVAIDDPDARSSEMAARDGSEVETLLRQADMAMYKAKTEGRGWYRFFDRDMDDRLQQRVKLEAEIKSAIANGEIVPYYQPIVELAGQNTIGYEVLARWLHPTEGLLSPAIFIPVAEDTGAISALTDVLLARALADAAAWPEHIFLSLNLSPRQFAEPWLAQKILGMLTKASFPPHRFEIEITETAVVKRLDEAKATLQSLRNVGVRIALDDFGTGYSGLYHLRELELDTIKIDRSFVSRMLEKPEDAKLVEAIVSLGHVLGLEITAEGIETQEVLDRLIELGCEIGQGYFLGKPSPIAVINEALREQAGDARQIA